MANALPNQLDSNVLGIDLGMARTGIAIWRNAVGLSLPLCVIEAKQFSDIFTQINALIQSHNISRLAIGIPIQPNGTVGDQAQFVYKFARFVCPKLEIPLYGVDERLTSKAVERTQFLAKMQSVTGHKARRGKGRKKKQVVDDLAAVLILDSFVNAPNSAEQLCDC